MKKRHIANLELTRLRASSDDVITLCGRTSTRNYPHFSYHERDLEIAWWYAGGVSMKNMCRTCLKIDGANNDPYKYASRQARG
jgi:hypothetical protein